MGSRGSGRSGERYYLLFINQEEELLIMFISPLMIWLYLPDKSLAISTSIYPHLTANSNHVLVSAASASQSFNLAMNAASDLRFLHASARLAHTEREERRI